MIEWFRFIGLLYKDYKLLFKKWQAPLLIILLPLLLIIVFSAGSSVSSSHNGVIGVCDFSGVGINYSGFRVVALNSTNQSICVDSLISGVRSGDFIIGVVIPEGFVASINNGRQGVINYYVDDSNPLTASLAGLFLKQALNDYSRLVVKSYEVKLHGIAVNARSRINSAVTLINRSIGFINSPLITNYLLMVNDELTSYDNGLAFLEGLSVDFLINPVVLNHQSLYDGINSSSFNFASVFAVVSLFSLLLLASSGVIFDRKSFFLLRVRVSGVWSSSYLLSKLFFYFTISLVQLLLVMLLMIPQGAVYNFSISSLIVSLFVIVSVNAGLGLLIGLLSGNETIAVLLSLTISLPFLFLSGVFFPLEFMPGWLRFIASVMPLSREVLLLKQAVVLGYSISVLESLIIELLMFAIVFLFSSFIIIRNWLH